MKWRYTPAAAALLFSSHANAIYSCSVSTTGLNFGQYRPFSLLPQDNNGNIAVSCQLLQIIGLLVSYEIRLSTGQSGTYTARQLQYAGNNLNYNLYRNAARTSVLGNGTAGTVFISDGYLLSLGVLTRNYAVYGRIPAGQNVRVGSYTDIITITVTY
ncbi:spore coat protein U-like protein [Rheinheimera pacifica]|uniref:spore coat U domain-containing protein n=1 Tax=Rheinheimera pacifica TaxID=173990 RepID=UPI002168F365|nr:spore coat U domain-containing protein [Rheinheimera pacifica]MCS4309360.1 spore coat protein U-like protein [Rheinheimera pacifica]